MAAMPPAGRVRASGGLLLQPVGSQDPKAAIARVRASDGPPPVRAGVPAQTVQVPTNARAMKTAQKVAEEAQRESDATLAKAEAAVHEKIIGIEKKR